jgi:hypothetical protein
MNEQTDIELSWTLEDCINDSDNEGLHGEAVARLRAELASLRARAKLADEIAGAGIEVLVIGANWLARYRATLAADLQPPEKP